MNKRKLKLGRLSGQQRLSSSIDRLTNNYDKFECSGKWIHRSVVSVSTNSTFLIVEYSVRLSLFRSMKVKGLDLAN